MVVVSTVSASMADGVAAMAGVAQLSA